MGVTSGAGKMLTLLEHLSSPLLFVGFVMLNIYLYEKCFIDNKTDRHDMTEILLKVVFI